MSRKRKNEYVEKMRLRYQSRGREGKSRLLDELVEACGLNRNHAIKLMNQPLGSTVGRIETRCEGSVLEFRISQPGVSPGILNSSHINPLSSTNLHDAIPILDQLNDLRNERLKPLQEGSTAGIPDPQPDNNGRDPALPVAVGKVFVFRHDYCLPFHGIFPDR